ncbi:MAG: LVIVD repeat-containing protein [Streptosporangiaceae bacterium]
MGGPPTVAGATGAVSTASAAGLRLLGQHDLGGYGDGMQVIRSGAALYVGHTGTTGMGTSVLDVADPACPVLVSQWPAAPRSHTHKVQVADGLLLVNSEKFPYRAETSEPFSAGLTVYELSDPLRPRQVGFWPSGGRGVHRIVWTGGQYAHMSAIPDGFRDRIWVVVDLSDPARPKQAGRWWWPGQREDEQPGWPAGKRYAAHHALIAGNRAYVGYDDAGLVILDVSDLTNPRQVGHLGWDGGSTHTCLPLAGRGLVVATDEQVRDGPAAPRRAVRVIDIASDQPRVLSVCPEPAGFGQLPLRFGAHNLHENQPGAYRSERLVFVSYFSAGLRVYDLADPVQPVEVAHWVPESPAGQPVPQINDLFVDDTGMLWVTDRIGGGLYVLQPEPALAALMAQARTSA